MEDTKIIDEYNQLQPYQQEKVHRQIIDYLVLNKQSSQYVINKCPKCGSSAASFTKGGFSNTGKQMLQCSECKRRFVIDHGQLTFYSHQKQDQWNQLIEDTFTLTPIEDTSATLNISTYTVWRMRMKLLHALEHLVSDVKLSDEIELDEKYLQNSHKGVQIEGVPSRHRGEPASKRGLSDEQICLSSGVQRAGKSFVQATNTGNPSGEDIMKIADHIAERSMVWIDGKTAYNQLIDLKRCECRVVGDHSSYTSVDHLNNVNSFHSMIEGWYQCYRGVASKYLNRYCALISIAREYMGCDIQEILLSITKRLRSISDFFRIEDMKTTDLFVYVQPRPHQSAN